MCETRLRAPVPPPHRGTTRARAGLLVACCLAAAAAGCAGRMAPAIDDAALAFAVRTALVNDSTVGGLAIDVAASNGTVVHEGRVPTAADRARALELARGVQGVSRIEDRIVVGVVAALPDSDAGLSPGRLSALAGDEIPYVPHWFAVGAGFGLPFPRSDALDGLLSIGPVFRLGRGAGWRPVITMHGLRMDLPPTIDTDAFGELRLFALGGGLGYGFTAERWTLSVGGSVTWNFNHIRLEPGTDVPVDVALPVAVGNSPGVVAGSTLWYEATRRVSIGITAGYLWTQPQGTWLEGDRFVRRQVDASAVLMGVNLAWWVF